MRRECDRDWSKREMVEEIGEKRKGREVEEDGKMKPFIVKCCIQIYDL